VKGLVLAVAMWSCAGCVAVAPYQRGYLARPDMAFEPSPGLGKALEKTIAFERGDFDSPLLAHSRAAVQIAYTDAVRWADSVAV